MEKEFLLLTFESILENSPDLIFIKDTNLAYIDASQVFSDLVKHQDRKTLVGKTDFDLFDEELAMRYTQDDISVLETGIPIVDNVEPLPDNEGRKSYSSTSKYPIRNKDGEIIGIYGIGRDVTAQVELEEEREYREFSSKMFEDVVEVDLTQNRLIRAKGAVLAKYLNQQKQFEFSKIIEMIAQNFIHRNHVEKFKHYFSCEKLFEDYQKGNKRSGLITYQKIDSDQYSWVELNSSLYYSKISNTLRLTVFLRDIDDDCKKKETLKIKAETDSLTGLLNRNSLRTQVPQFLQQNGGKQQHALLFFDVDYFKQINDRYGHPIGDDVLRQIADNLKLLVQGKGVAGRIGGDEFLVFFKNAGREEAFRAAKDIAKLVGICELEDGKQIKVSLSVGISLYQADGKTLDQLYEEADKAMYRAKETGRNRIILYQDMLP